MSPRIALTYHTHLHRVIELGACEGLVDAVEIVPSGYLLAGNYGLLRERLAEIGLPYSFHFVEGSLASADFIDNNPCAAMAALIEQFEPLHVSDHLTCARIGDEDLEMNLPILMTDLSLEVCIENLAHFSEALACDCPVLIEHVPSYFRFKASTWQPERFFAAVVQQSGFGVLLDLHNLYCDELNQASHGVRGEAFIDCLPEGCVNEIHLAGGRRLPGADYIDTHDSDVPPRVFELLDYALEHSDPRLIVLEREHRFGEPERVVADLHRIRESIH